MVNIAAVGDLTLPPMLEQGTIRDRLIEASEDAGYGGDTSAARAQLARTLGVSPGAISKYFSGKSGLSPTNVFLAADLFGVSARWLATGRGPKKVDELPPEILDLAQAMLGIQDAAARRAAIASARLIARDPVTAVANFMSAMAEGPSWSPTVRRIADHLEAMPDGEQRRLAFSWATIAAF